MQVHAENTQVPDELTKRDKQNLITSSQVIMSRLIPLLSVIPLLMIGPGCIARYAPNWTSLDARPLPQWFDEAKVGIFVHWGVFSVPGFGNFSEWFWYWWQSEKRADVVEFMQRNYPKYFKYTGFAHEFRAEFFDPDAWAEIFKASGARYGRQLRLFLAHVDDLGP